MEKITRRRFLRDTAAAGAVVTAIAASVVAVASIPKTARERFDAALDELKAAAQELDPLIERWDAGFATDAALTMRVVITAHRRTGKYEGDGTYEAGEERPLGGYTPYQVRLLKMRIDGHRVFDVRTSMDRMVLTEPRLNTFIGKRVA